MKFVKTKRCMTCSQRGNDLEITGPMEMLPFLPNKDKMEEELHHEEG